jgi:beta-phosphoglucomutase
MNETLAAIFDMDGVLVDSYQAHHESWKAAAQRAGLRISPAQFGTTFGRTSREIIATLWSDRPWSDDQIRTMDDAKEAAFREIIAAHFPVMPGAGELLLALHRAGFALAVGSSGPPANVELVLDWLGHRDLWGAIVTGRDVVRGKPDPQVFLLAAQRLGVPPRRCAVVEDAPPGVEAAHAAGMAAIGLVSTGRTRDVLAQADLVVDSLGELTPDRVQRLIGSR